MHFLRWPSRSSGLVSGEKSQSQSKCKMTLSRVDVLTNVQSSQMSHFSECAYSEDWPLQMLLVIFPPSLSKCPSAWIDKGPMCNWKRMLTRYLGRNAIQHEVRDGFESFRMKEMGCFWLRPNMMVLAPFKRYYDGSLNLVNRSGSPNGTRQQNGRWLTQSQQIVPQLEMNLLTWHGNRLEIFNIKAHNTEYFTSEMNNNHSFWVTSISTSMIGQSTSNSNLIVQHNILANST